MDYKLLAEEYIRYSIWFLKTGSAIFEKEKEELRKAIEIEVSSGLSESEAYYKASKTIKQVEHPDQNGAWKVDEIIKNGGPAAWEILKNIVQAAPNDEQVLAFIGAGPFENWISEEKLIIYKKELFEAIQEHPKWQTVAESSWHNPADLVDFLETLNKSKEE